jgi:hypothetical protein
VSEDPEAQASARLDAIIAAMKLTRIAGSESLETVQDQAAAVRDLAGALTDVEQKNSLIRQANLAEAGALEKAAREEGERAKQQADQMLEIERRTSNMKAALEGIGQEVSVEIKPGAQMEKTKQDLTEIVHLIELIKQHGPINVNTTAPAGTESLRTLALQHGRR